MTKTYTVQGGAARTREDVFTAFGEAVNGPGGYFGSNLDALADCLRGGFGTPSVRGFRFVLTGADNVREVLGAEDWSALQKVFASNKVELVTD